MHFRSPSKVISAAACMGLLLLSCGMANASSSESSDEDYEKCFEKGVQHKSWCPSEAEFFTSNGRISSDECLARCVRNTHGKDNEICAGVTYNEDRRDCYFYSEAAINECDFSKSLSKHDVSYKYDTCVKKDDWRECFEPKAWGETWCPGKADFFGVERDLSRNTCLESCARNTHRFEGKICYGVTFNNKDGRKDCYYYDKKTIDRCGLEESQALTDRAWEFNSCNSA